MTLEVFEKVIKFLKVSDPMLVLVSGGEPLEHPNFFDMVNRIKKTMGVLNSETSRIVVTSNGMFTKDKDLLNKVCNLGVNIQIVNDAKYYPIKIEDPKRKNILYFDYMAGKLIPMGRALSNNLEITRQSPQCFNLRSFARTLRLPLPLVIKMMEARGKFCTPMISIDGGIMAGESSLCPPFAYVDASMDKITSNLNNFTCNKCGLMKNLDKNYLTAIGEDRNKL
jgi:hypothetical protein